MSPPPARTSCGASETSSATAPSPTLASSWPVSTRRSASRGTTTWPSPASCRWLSSRAAPRSRRAGPRRSSSPRTWRISSRFEPAGHVEGIGLYHASPRDPVWEYVLSALLAEMCLDAAQERIALIGHSHVALSFVRREGDIATGERRVGGDSADLVVGEWLLNPGSVGQPRDGDSRAAWLLLDRRGGGARGGASSTTWRAPRPRSATPGYRTPWPNGWGTVNKRVRLPLFCAPAAFSAPRRRRWWSAAGLDPGD